MQKEDDIPVGRSSPGPLTLPCTERQAGTSHLASLSQEAMEPAPTISQARPAYTSSFKSNEGEQLM